MWNLNQDKLNVKDVEDLLFQCTKQRGKKVPISSIFQDYPVFNKNGVYYYTINGYKVEVQY